MTTNAPSSYHVLNSWERIRVKVGKRTAQIEYDPTKTSAKDLEALIKALNKSVKK